MGAFVNHSLSVKSVWSEHFAFMRDRPDKSIALARKLRPLYAHLRDPENVAPVAPVAGPEVAVIAEPAVAGSNQLGSLL